MHCNLSDQLDHTNALRLVGVLLAAEGVVVDGYAQAHQCLVDALHVLGVRVHAAGRVGHGFEGSPVAAAPVSRVDQLTEREGGKGERGRERERERERERGRRGRERERENEEGEIGAGVAMKMHKYHELVVVEVEQCQSVGCGLPCFHSGPSVLQNTILLRHPPIYMLTQHTPVRL
jgi:hypothetical protein